MNVAVLFALMSLLCVGINDVVFKRYSRKTRSRGMYLSGIGLMWLVLQCLLMHVNGEAFATDANTILWGIAGGLLLTIANLLLLECFTHLDVSLGSSIYRLNTIGVVVLSYLFLAESLDAIKLLAIACGVVAVLLLYQRPDRVVGVQVFGLSFWIAILASVLRASYGVTTKAGLTLGANRSTIVALFALSWILGGLCYAGFRERRVIITTKKIGYSALSGTLVFLNVNFLVAGLEYGEASIVVPIANLGFLVAFVIAVVLRMERLSLRKCLALGCAILSIVLLSTIS